MTKIFIDAQRELSEVNRLVFGHFHEHAFKNIYGGVYDPGNELSDKDGFRKDVLKALKQVSVPILRYPGGNFVSNYHWQDGIGPKEQRRKVFEYAWKTEESNEFGTADFIDLCRKLGAEPYFCVNMGTGTIEEAMQWVEYCNGTGDTYYANLRRKHGYAEPFNVKYWGLGNEVYGPWQMGYLGASDYTKMAVEFAKAMKWADSSIKLIACGYEQSSDWNYEILKQLSYYVDYISAHHYSVGWGPFDRNDYLQLMCIPEYMKKLNDMTKSAINCACNNNYGRIKVAWDEWNMFGWLVDDVNEDASYTLQNAVVTASVLNFFIRNSDSIEIANYSTFVNINGAISVNKDGIVLRPQYYSFELIGNNIGNKQIDCFVQGETFSVQKLTNHKFEREKPANILNGYDPDEKFHTYTVNYIDSVATSDEEYIYISVVNKHPDKDILTEFSITGCNIDPNHSAMKSLFHEDVYASNTVDNPDNVKVITVEGIEFSEKFTIDIPKHSVNIIKLKRY